MSVTSTMQDHGTHTRGAITSVSQTGLVEMQMLGEPQTRRGKGHQGQGEPCLGCEQGRV